MGFVDLDGAKIHFEECGSGPAVLFVHGWGASWRFFATAMRRLAPARRCIAIDWKGMGDSDKPVADYRMEDYADEVRKVADRLGLQRFVLVGHSMGGMVSALFATLHPERLLGVGLINAPVRGPTAFSRRTKLLVLPVIRWIAWLGSRIPWVRRMASGDFTYRTRLEDWVFDDFAKGTYCALFRSIGRIAELDLTERLASIRVPALVIYSDHDRIIRSDQFALACERIPGARPVLLSPVGHCPMLEEPERCGAALQAFLDEVQPVPASTSAAPASVALPALASGSADSAPACAVPAIPATSGWGS